MRSLLKVPSFSYHRPWEKASLELKSFNSILENAPYLLQVVAKQLLGASGTVAGLRRKMKDGELSSKDFFNALLAGSGEVDASFSKVGLTTGKALTKLKNTFIKFIGAIEEKLGVVDKLTRLITKAADAFNLLSKNQDDIEVDNVRKLRQEIKALNEDIPKAKTDDRKNYLQTQLNIKQGRLNRLQSEFKEALGVSQLQEKELINKANEILEKNLTSRDKVEATLKKLDKAISLNVGTGSGYETGAGDDYSKKVALLEDYQKYLKKGGEFSFGEEDVAVLNQVLDGIGKLPEISLKAIEKNIQTAKKLLASYESSITETPTTQPVGVSSSGNSEGNVAPKIDTEAIERDAEAVKKIQELIKSSLAYPETDLEKNKRTLQAFIDEYKDKGEQFKQVVEDAYFAIGEIDIDINEQKLKKEAEKVQSIAEKVADNIKNIFSVISDGISTLFSNQLLELERFYEKQAALLEQETEEEELYKELKAEREAEEFQEKFGIKQEEFYQLNQADQEAYIKSLDEKEKAEELANLSAVKSREKRDQQIAKLEEEKAAKEKAIKSKQFDLEKGSKIAEIWANVALGIVKLFAAYSSLPGVGQALAWVQAGILTGIGTAQTTNISKQKNPYAYREGGIAITPQLAALAEAGQPELVLNAELTKHIRDSFANRNDALDPTPSVVNNTINIQSNDPIAVAEELNDRLGINL